MREVITKNFRIIIEIVLAVFIVLFFSRLFSNFTSTSNKELQDTVNSLREQTASIRGENKILLEAQNKQLSDISENATRIKSFEKIRLIIPPILHPDSAYDYLKRFAIEDIQ